MTRPNRMAFVFGDLTMTLSEADIEQVYRDWETAHPGQTIKNMTSKEFSDTCMEKIKASARPTRTVLHN